MSESIEGPKRGGARPGAGRPRVGLTLARAMREAFPPERIVALAEDLAERAESEQVRLAALQLIADRAHGKPIATTVIEQTLDVRVDRPAVPAAWDSMTDREREAWIDQVRARALLPAGPITDLEDLE